MAKGINKVILVGNLGADPETRFTAANMPVANLSIATSEQWTDKQSGQKQEKTEWHRVVLFNKTAEIAQQYLRKGSKVYIEGRLETQKWQDQNGQERYTTQIVANDMQMLDSPNGGGQQGQPQQPVQQGNYQQQPQQPQQGGYQQPQQNGQADYRGHSGSNQPNPTYGQPQGQMPQGMTPDTSGEFNGQRIPF